jgi:4-hydroxybenzoate polyprenyltransferase
MRFDRRRMTPPERAHAFLQLMRPANLVTAAADVLAGAAVAGALLDPRLLPLVLASVLLYGGGVVMNDVFDAPLDARERPERPIPSGRVTRTEGLSFGSLLLLSGALVAASVHSVSGALAAAIGITALLYDGYAKRSPVLGPIAMGLCRAFNLLLGMSLVPAALLEWWAVALLPLLHVSALTALSRGEVHGGRRVYGYFALASAVVVAGGLIGLGTVRAAWLAIAFALFYAGAVGPSYVRALKRGDARTVRDAIKSGVLALIVLDAGLVAVYANALYGALVLLLLPASLALARRFAVT